MRSPFLQTSLRPFTFAKVQLTDDADLACDDETYVKALGTIEVRICRINYLGARALVGRAYTESKPKVGLFDFFELAPGADFGPAQVMNEKSKKAVLSHQTGLGAAKYVPPTGVCDVQWIEQPEHPYFTFVFTYRSRGSSASRSFPDSPVLTMVSSSPRALLDHPWFVFSNLGPPSRL